MKTSPFLLAPIVAALLMPTAYAITLGEPQLKSYLGQQFKADIPYRLNGDERLFDGCYQIAPSNNDVTYLGSVAIQIIPQSDGSSGVLRISSPQIAQEPILGFALKIECESLSLTRDFTVFLDPAPLIEAPVVAVNAAKGNANPGNRKLTRLNQAESLEDIATRHYPDDAQQAQRYLSRLKTSNPNIASNDVLPVGTEILIPRKLKPVVARRSEPPATVPAETARLRLDGEEKPSVDATSAAYVKQLEAKVQELSDLRRKLQIEIDALDQKLAQSQRAVDLPVAASAAARVVAAASAVKVAAPAISNAKELSEHSQTNSNWQWPSIAILSLLGLGTWWWVQRRRDEDGDENNDSVFVALKTNFMPRHHVTQQTLGAQIANGFEVTSDDGQGIDQVQYFLAQGETPRAIELLQQLLSDDPLDTERWLMLFRVYRQQGMKSDYIQLAKKFKARTPEPEEDDWELVRSIGYKLAPECELFSRDETPKAGAVAPETPIDLAINSLVKSSPAAATAAVAGSVASATAVDHEIDLIQLLQSPPVHAAKRVPMVEPIENIEIELPALTEVRDDSKDLSSLDQLDFNIAELQFDDDKKSETK